MKRYMFGLAALAAVLIIAGVALAANRKDDKPGFIGYADKLNLTTEQKGKLIDLQEKYVTDKEKIRDEIVKNVFDMKRLYLAPTPDVKAIDKVQDQIKDLRGKNRDLSRSFRDSARALLTPDQLKAAPYAFMGHRDGFGMGPGFGRCFGGDRARGDWGHGWRHERGHHRWHFLGIW